jgi:soluble lytic murein transglycosylase-like protein
VVGDMKKPVFAVSAYLVAMGSCGQLLRAQSPLPGNAGNPIEQQRGAAAAMESSLAKQRASVQKQLGQQGESAGFFVLPPPSRMGLTPAPALAISTEAAPSDDCAPLPVPRVEALVGDAARRAGIDEALLRGVMKAESAFRPCAVSSKGAMGLMQLMPATAEQFGVTDPFDPVDNVEAGAKLLKELMTRYNGDLNRVLGAYNAGPSTVDNAGGIPGIPETWNYVHRILSELPLPKQ